MRPEVVSEQESIAEQNLYGVRLFLTEQYTPEEVKDYIYQQEMTHLAEGLELQQRQVRTLEYDGLHVLGFGGQPMVEVNKLGYLEAKKQYLKGDQAAYFLMKRREHDVTMSECVDDLMAEGEVGDTILVASPYQEELDDEEARRLGFWPNYRRSYLWLYRKKDANELECTDISIDHSNVATYKQLLSELGAKVPTDSQSHDIPAYPVQLFVATESDRAQLVQQLIDRYKKINHDINPPGTDEAMAFLDRHAREQLHLIVDVHQAIAESKKSGNLHDLVRLSASRALRTLECLNPSEVYALENLLRSEPVSSDHTLAFSTLIAAQRYGVWEGISKIASGQEPQPAQTAYHPESVINVALLMDQIYANTNQAAEQHKTMPGCSGGLSFFQQDQESVKASIFDAEKYSFNKEMYCVVCQAPPKENAKKKWCGPCGICKTCDIKLKSKTS